MNNNDNSAWQNLWGAVKAALKGQFIALSNINLSQKFRKRTRKGTQLIEEINEIENNE